MGFRHSVLAMVAPILLLPPMLHAGKKASCTFDTFSAPSGYTLNMVQGIGDDGTVVGQLIDNETQVAVGFLRAPSGDITVYDAPKSSNTWVYGQNASNTSAGTFTDSKKGSVHGFTLTGSTFTQFDYPKAANTWLFGVNQLGSLAGSFANGTNTKGFLLSNTGKYTTIAYSGQQATYAMALNDNGAVVGYYASGWVNYGFLWQNGKFTDIDYPKAKFGTVLNGINNAGIIVGNRLTADTAQGFIYQNSAFKNIVYAGAKYTMTGGINNNGVISGLIFYNSTKSLGFTATCK